MITKDQIYSLAKKNKINQTVILREYFQLLFLNEIYSQNQSKNIFFKGGTSLHLIYKSPRFSEDLDFTVQIKEKEFLKFIQKILLELSKKENIGFKEKKSIAGKRFLLTVKSLILPYEAFINLDFSFREKVLEPQKSIIETNFPIIFTSYIYHLSKEEIFAEKIRALLTRVKGRDIYDLWFLLNQGVSFKQDLVRKKLKYYHLEKISKEEILKRIKRSSKKDFVLDIRPFISIDQRSKLEEFFDYIQDYLEKNLNF